MQFLEGQYQNIKIFYFFEKYPALRRKSPEFQRFY